MQQFEILDETPQDNEEDTQQLQQTQGTVGGADATFKDQKGRYRGDINPVSKLRNGTGTYTYTNPFFQYQGEWVNGKKHGQGVLIMKDGSKFVGEFKDGEICGQGTKTYECGMCYTGGWLNGERHGQGECKYGLRNYTEVKYIGNWCSNIR